MNIKQILLKNELHKFRGFAWIPIITNHVTANKLFLLMHINDTLLVYR